MRLATVSIGLLVFTTQAYAQVTLCTSQAYTYDAYKPSDLAIVREYGGTALAQAPLSTLLKLDPYNPSQGELLRQLGRGIPLWAAYPWYPSRSMPVAPECEPAPEPGPPSPPVLSTFADMLSTLEHARATAVTDTAAPATRGTGAERTRGVWIHYAGRAWVSAGVAVPFRDEEFTRVGESAGVSVFRRTGATDDLIFVPTTRGMVAPFRATP